MVILTTQANESMVKIHDRMPLIIKEEQIEEWLGGMEGRKALLGQVPEKLKKSMEYEQQAFEFNWKWMMSAFRAMAVDTGNWKRE